MKHNESHKIQLPANQNPFCVDCMEYVEFLKSSQIQAIINNKNELVVK